MAFKIQTSAFSRIAKTYREMNHMSQIALSDKSGVNVVYISQYEQGKRAISVNDFIKLMNAVGFDVKIAIRGKGDKKWQKISEAD